MTQAKTVHQVDAKPPAKPRYDMRWRNGTWHIFDTAAWRVYDARSLRADAQATLDVLLLMEALRRGMRPSKREARHGQKH